MLETIEAAKVRSKTGYDRLEQFEINGDIVSKIATPVAYEASTTLKFPSTEVTSSAVASTVAEFRVTLKDDEPYMWRSLFPEGTLNGDGKIETPKPFRLDNSGGDGVTVADFIESAEILEPVFSIPLDHETTFLREETKDTTREEIWYSPEKYSSSIIPNFNPNIPIVTNFMNGVFNGLCTASTTQFQLKYNKELYNPVPWVDGSKDVIYTRYCRLVPDFPEFKSALRVTFRFDSDNKNFLAYIRHIYTKAGVQYFYSIVY